jgi:outer membrane protein TolC
MVNAGLPVVAPAPTPSPGLPAATGAGPVDFGDPGPSSIERATHVQPAIFPIVPRLPQKDVVPPAGALAASTTIVGVDGPFVGISLDDAIALALSRNSDLAVSQANRRIAAFRIVSDSGAYDVKFQLVPSYSHGVSASTNPLISGPDGGPITQDILGATSAFTGLLPDGATYNVSLTGERVTTNSLASAYDPYYVTSLELDLTQPLLRNRAIDATRRQVLDDRYTLQADTAAAYVQAQTTILDVTDAYWSLEYAWQQVAVGEAALRQAELQAQSNGRQVIRGRVAASDVVQATAQVAAFQGQVATALQTVGQEQIALKNLIIGDRGDPIWRANLVPLTAVESPVPEPDLHAAIAQALAHRPELAELDAERRSSAVDIAYARDQLKPQLDVGVTVNPTGLSGVPTPATLNPFAAQILENISNINALTAAVDGGLGAGVPPTANLLPMPPNYQNGGFGTSVKNLFDGRFPTYSVSLTLGIPIGNHTARGAFDEAVESDRSLQVRQAAEERNIAADATNVVEALRTDLALLASARDQRQTTQQVYLSELRRIAVGRSTEFLVLQRLVALADARRNELLAQANYSKALADYRLVTGDLLTSSGVDVTKVGTMTLGATTGPAPLTTIHP